MPERVNARPTIVRPASAKSWVGGDATSTFVSAFGVLDRTHPIEVYSRAAGLYCLPGVPFRRNKVPTWCREGDPLEFVRFRDAGIEVYPCGPTLIITDAIANTLSSLAEMRIRQATCVGLHDFDVTDTKRVMSIDDRLGPNWSSLNVCRVAGRQVRELEWKEIIPWREPDDNDMSAIKFDFISHAKAVRSENDFYEYPRFSVEPWHFGRLLRHGILNAQVFLMSRPVASVLVPRLPPALWHIDYWHCDCQ